jgi:two-component system phosphate regulon response regulator OmpR
MPHHILVVDDDTELREILKALLELDGHKVWAAKDAAEAILLMGERLASVFVIDDDLPDMSGSHLALHLKAMVETINPNLPCVGVAIRGDVAPGEVSAIDGFDYLLFKPAAYEQLAKVLGNLAPDY